MIQVDLLLTNNENCTKLYKDQFDSSNQTANEVTVPEELQKLLQHHMDGLIITNSYILKRVCDGYCSGSYTKQISLLMNMDMSCQLQMDLTRVVAAL